MIDIITYNCHLGIPFRTYEEEARRKRICELIKASQAPVVCLCEVWMDSDKMLIIDALKDSYPYYYYQARDWWNMGNGLLVVSKFPLYDGRCLAFKERAGIDQFTQKGVLAISVLAGLEESFRLLLTHTQAGEACGTARLNNLQEIAQLAKDYSPKTPTIILGDLNVAAKNTKAYQEMMAVFPSFTDSYFYLHPQSQGFTLSTSKNELAQRWVKGEPDQRLDYILASADWTIHAAEVLHHWQLDDGRLLDCSDHYPLRAQLTFKNWTVEDSAD